MPLQRQKVDLIPKLNQAVDPRTAPPGTAVIVQNATRARAQEYKRRTGSTALGTSGVPSGTLPNVWQLGTHKGSLVALAQAGSAMPWAYSESAALWAASRPTISAGYPLRSSARGAITSSRRSVWVGEVPTGSFYQPPPHSTDIAIIPGTSIAVIVWGSVGTSGSLVTELVYDLATDTPLHRATLGGYSPHVEATGTAATVAYYDFTTGKLGLRTWTAAAVAAGGPHGVLTSITSGASGAAVYLDTCVTPTANKIAIALVGASGSSVTVCIYDNSTHALATNAVTADANLSLGLLRDHQNTGSVYLVTAGSTAGLKLHICSGTTGAETSSTTLSTDASTTKANVVNIAGYTTPGGTAGDYTVLWDVLQQAVSSTNHFDAQILSISKTAGVLGAAAVWLRSVRLRSKPQVISGSEMMVLTAYDSEVQPTYFLFQISTTPDSTARSPTTKIFRNTATSRIATVTALAGFPLAVLNVEVNADVPSGVTNLISYNGQWLMALTRAEEHRVMAGLARDSASVNVVTLTANPTTTGRPVEYADLMLVPAGQALAYDGVMLSELNFCVAPETPGYTLVSGGSLSVESDTGVPSVYEYVIVYRHTDSQGRIHRSAPSVPLSVTLPSDGSEKEIDLKIPTCRILGHNDTAASNDAVIVEIYRTGLSGTDFGLLWELANDPTADYVTFNDSGYWSPDGSTELYCSVDPLQNPPGPLESQSPPQFVAMCTHRGRLWGIDADDARRVWFSEPLASGIGPIFNEELTFMVDDEWGDCTAIASMDDKLVVFKRGALYVVVGDGPDNTGIGTYPQAQRIAVGPGTASARSVSATPEGVWFQSPKGLYLLDRGLNATEAGLVAEDIISGATVVDVVHVDAESQVRLYLSTGTCLVRDYTWQEWYHWTGQSTYAAVKYGTKVAQVSPGTGNVVWVSDSTVWADAGTGYTMKFTLAWLATAGITGFQRVYEILALGEYVATHNVRIAVSYDYVDTVVETREVVGAAPWQFRLKPQQQKCHGIKIAVYDVVSGGAVPTGDTFKFSGLAMIAGVKSAGAKLPAAQRFGPTSS